MESSTCPICDSWSKTPHAARFTTPIPPQYAEETMVIGYWLGIRHRDTQAICKKHLVGLKELERQYQKRTMPTVPPPRAVAMQEMATAIQNAEKMRATIAVSPPPGFPPQVLPPMPPVTPAAITDGEQLRDSFMAIAQACAVEFAKKNPAAQSQPPPPMPEVAPDVLRQALAAIAQNSKDPEAAEFATKVLEGNAVPPIPAQPAVTDVLAMANPPSPTTEFPCPLCSKSIKPGEVHAC